MENASHRAPRRNGFTLIEILVTLAIIVVIGAVVVVNLSQRRVDTDLTSTVQEIATTLRQAESDSMAVENGVTWGVHFANSTATPPFYALFSGSSYATGTVEGYYRLPSTVAYQPSTLAAGATLDVVFSAVSGAVSSATIGLYMPNENAAFSSTISVSPTGAVSY